MKKCYIIAAGEVSKLDLEPQKEDFVIAVDGGLDSVIKANIKPDLILGDFDSLGYKPKGESVLTLPTEKDDTDTLAAIKYALENGAEKIYIYGGTGGRIDHTIANIQSLKYIAEKGKEGYLISEKEIITAITNNKISFCEDATGTISVFSLGECAIGVDIKGLRYELLNATLKNNYPLGVSNSFNGQKVTVSVEKGSLLIVFSDSLDKIL